VSLLERKDDIFMPSLRTHLSIDFIKKGQNLIFKRQQNEEKRNMKKARFRLNESGSRHETAFLIMLTNKNNGFYN
jgi:hypothetical protein